MSDTKYCPDCGEERPISAFYQYPDKRYKAGYRLSEYCQTHQDERDAQRMKYCPECGFERPASDFYEISDSRYRGGVRLSTYCKQHTNEAQSEWLKQKRAEGDLPPSKANRDYKNEMDPEKRREINKRSYEKHRDERIQKSREWEEREENKERRREYKRKWYQEKKKKEQQQKQRKKKKPTTKKDE
jgi:hypothetical protein